MRNFLTISYIALAIILACAASAYVFGEHSSIEWLKDLSLNLGTEVTGIFLTVFLIDAAIRRNEAAERQRVKRVAFQQLRVSLIRHLHMLHGMYKAATTSLPESKPVAVADLFTDSYFAQLGFLDFAKPAPVASAVPQQWMDYLRTETENFKAALGRTLEKYAVFLDGETVELLEELLASSYLSLLSQITAIRDIDKKERWSRRYNLLAGQGMTEIARSHTAEFVKLIESHNLNVPSDRHIKLDDGYWRNDIAPPVGSGRIDGV